MNKAELIEALAQHYEGSKAEATKALNAFVHTVSATTAAGDRVAITGFGVFERVERPARTVRNPRTGEQLQAPATAVPRFRAGTELKAYVAGSRPVPDLVVPPTPTRRVSAPVAESEPEAPVGRVADAAPAQSAAPKTGKDVNAKKADAKKADSKKSAPNKSAPKKSDSKKGDSKKVDSKKIDSKKIDAKKSATKKGSGKKDKAKSKKS